MPYGSNVLNRDPLFVDLGRDNVRLRQGSPAIRAGVGGATIGAVDYPNVYYVDARHAGASDQGFGYAGAPFKTIAKAVSVAEGGETIVVRGGVYRELVKPARALVTLKAAGREKVVVTGADEIRGWTRQGERWAAPLAAKPTKVLRDNQVLEEFTYDDLAKTIVVSRLDPRLHLMETVVRRNAIDLSGAPTTRIEAIETADTLGDAVLGKGE
jgi:hypothetical protein